MLCTSFRFRESFRGTAEIKFPRRESLISTCSAFRCIAICTSLAAFECCNRFACVLVLCLFFVFYFEVVILHCFSWRKSHVCGHHTRPHPEASGELRRRWLRNQSSRRPAAPETRPRHARSMPATRCRWVGGLRVSCVGGLPSVHAGQAAPCCGFSRDCVVFVFADKLLCVLRFSFRLLEFVARPESF